MDFGNAITGLVIIGAYFMPGIIAGYRGHQSQNSITVVNLFLGWTGIGWVIALAWALTGTSKQAAQEIANAIPSDSCTCPHCAEVIKKDAKVCRFCGRDTVSLPAEQPKPAEKPRANRAVQQRIVID